jgi:hypothetical protein
LLNGFGDLKEATNKSYGVTEEDFLKADVSKDGLFTDYDIKLKARIASFKKVDTDNNGKLNFSEWLRTY